MSMYGKKVADEAEGSSDSARILPDKISSGDMTSCSPKSIYSSENALKSLDSGGKHVISNVKGNVAGKARRKNERSRVIEKRNALAHIEKKRKEKNKEIRLLSKGSPLSSKLEKRIIEPKSPDPKAVSFRKGKEVRNRDRQDCSMQVSEENDSDRKRIANEKQKMVLNETFDLSDEGDESHNVLDTLVDDVMEGSSLLTNKIVSPSKKEKHTDGRHNCPKASDGRFVSSGKSKLYSGAVRVLDESKSEESEDLEDNVKGIGHMTEFEGNKNLPKNLAASMKASESESFGEKDIGELHSILDHEGEDRINVGRDLSGTGYSTGEHSKKETASGSYGVAFGNGSDVKCLGGLVNNNRASLELQRHVAESPRSALDDMDTIVMTDAGGERQQRPFPHDVLEVWDVPQTLVSNDALEGYFVVDPKTREPWHSNEVTKGEYVSSDNGTERDPGLVKVDDSYEANEAYDLLLGKGLHKSSLKIKAKQRRRTLFPKVLPDEYDNDSSKSKANLSADSQPTRSTCFSPLVESSKVFVFDADSVKGIGEVVQSKGDSILAGDKTHMAKADVLSSNANEKREAHHRNSSARHDTVHGDLISERPTKTDVVSSEESNSRIHVQLGKMEDDQESSSEVLKLLKQVYIDPASKSRQTHVEKHTEQVTHCGLIAVQQGQNSQSHIKHTSTTVGNAQHLLGQAKQVKKSPQRKLERGKNTSERASAGKSMDYANEIQRNRKVVPGDGNKCRKEVIDDVDYGQTLHTKGEYSASGRRTKDDNVYRTDEGVVDNDAVVVVDDVVLRDTRTSTPIKSSEDAGASQLRIDRKNATKGDQVTSMKTSRSPRLSDVPDCLQSMPRLVPMEQSDNNIMRGLPVFLDQNLQSTSDSFS